MSGGFLYVRKRSLVMWGHFVVALATRTSEMSDMRTLGMPHQCMILLNECFKCEAKHIFT